MATGGDTSMTGGVPAQPPAVCGALWPGCSRKDCGWPNQPCVAGATAPGQLGWMRAMERTEQEVFPDARQRSEVIVEVDE